MSGAEVELKPCPFCGSSDIVEWNGKGTQADIMCRECCCERGVQVIDLYDGPRSRPPEFCMTTFMYPDWLIAIAKDHLRKEWNTRASPPSSEGKLREALEPFATVARHMFASGHCGGASPEDFPPKWFVHLDIGPSHFSPQQGAPLLTVADFRRAEEAIRSPLSPNKPSPDDGREGR